MMKTIIYRIENADKLGPYQSNGRDRLTDRHYNSAECPSPHCDGINFHTYVHYSAFASIEQLTAWFGDVLDILKKEGYSIAVYEVLNEAVLFGCKQVAFVRDYADFLYHLNVDDVIRQSMTGSPVYA